MLSTRVSTMLYHEEHRWIVSCLVVSSIYGCVTIEEVVLDMPYEYSKRLKYILAFLVATAFSS